MRDLMPFYLAPLIDVGTPQRRRRVPVGFDSQATRNQIYLDNGQAIFWAQDAVADGRLSKLGDAADEPLAVATRGRLTALSGHRPYRGTDTIRGTIADLLVNSPAGRWQGLRPSKRRARYEVWLGPGRRGRNLLWEQAWAPGPNTKTYTDTFNGRTTGWHGDTSSDGLFTWTEYGTGVGAVASNVLTITPDDDGQYHGGYASADVDTDDGYAYIDLSSFTRAGSALNLLVATRYKHDLESGWALDIFQNASDTYVSLHSYAGNFPDDTNALPTIPARLMIEADGSTITAYVDDVPFLGPATDTSNPGGADSRKAEIRASGNTVGLGNSVTINAFGYGDVAVAAGVTSRPLIHSQAVRRASRY